MNWYSTYNRKFISYDLILRDPLKFNSFSKLALKKNLSDFACNFEISFSKKKNKDFGSLVFYSVLKEISMGNKVYFSKLKGLSGGKIFKLSSKSIGVSSCLFIDFFLHLIIRGLKRRYILLKTTQTNTGILNFRFSSIAELEIDDYFFFDLEEFTSQLNVFFKQASHSQLNYVYGLFFKNIFNLSKLLKYEVFSGKG